MSNEMSNERPPDQVTTVDVTDEPEVPPEPAHRPDGKGYIDEQATEYGSEHDGSSVEESLDSDDERSHGGWPEEEVAVGEDEEDEEDLDWGVENEDWELADGGECRRDDRGVVGAGREGVH